MGVCRKEELKETIVLGISVGGNVALQLGLDHPEISKALVLVGCSSGPSDHGTRIDGYMKEGTEQYHIKRLRALVSEEFSGSALGKYPLGLFPILTQNLIRKL